MPSSSGLSPDQHRTLRTQLALIPAYVWLVYVWTLFFRQLPRAADLTESHLVRDFLHFYTQGVIAREHNAFALYDIDAMAAVADRVLPGIPKHVFPPVYGPQVALLFAPLASLSYLSALYVWLGLTVVVTGVCLVLAWRESPGRTPRRAWVLAALACGAPGLHFTLSFGQASVIGLCAFTTLWVALQHHRPLLAGVAIGLLAYKPQLGIVAAAVFLWRREWWVVAGATASIAVQLLVAVVYWGPTIVAGYLGALRRLPSVFGAMEPDPQLAYSLRAVLQALGLAPGAAVALSVAIAFGVIWIVVANWRPSTPLPLRFASLVFASLLVNPHLYGYDLLLGASAMIVAAGWASATRDLTMEIALGALYVSPLLAAVFQGPPLLVTAGLAGAVAVVVRRSSRSEQV